MNFLPNEKTVLFIDGQHLFSASRNLAFDVDYRNLLAFFSKKTNIVRAIYYAAILEDDEYTPLKPLTDWLSYNGYTTVLKPAREYFDSTNGKRRVKGSVDIEIATDMLSMKGFDHAVLFGGDADYRYLIQHAKRNGTRVSVVSTIQTSPAMAADDLRREADVFIDLNAIRENFTRVRAEPAPAR